MIYILPYKRFSKSAKELKKLLKGKFKLEHTPAHDNQFIINWGNSTVHHMNGIVLNRPAAVKLASNKLTALRQMKRENVSVCEFTTDKNVVKEWMEEGYRVVCRTLLRSNSGKGIIIIKDNDAIPNAPLYTKYHKKTNEFRVHVFDGKVVDYIEKKKKHDRGDEFNNLIRSYANGWVFCRDDILHRDDVKKEAIKAVKALGLDFGACDLILHKNKPIVLEVNTAPGLENSTLNNYAKAIRDLYDSRNSW